MFEPGNFGVSRPRPQESKIHLPFLDSISWTTRQEHMLLSVTAISPPDCTLIQDKPRVCRPSRNPANKSSHSCPQSHLPLCPLCLSIYNKMKAVTSFQCVLTVWVIASLLFIASFTPSTNAKCNFPAIFNFGDSNSDTGGFWAAFPAQRSPFGMTYFKKPVGRATDGRLAIDFLGNSWFIIVQKSLEACFCFLWIFKSSSSFVLFSLCEAQALGLPFISPYLQSIGSDFQHGANFATLASTVLLPNTSLFVTGVSPFSLAIQLNQMKELRERVLEIGMHMLISFGFALVNQNGPISGPFFCIKEGEKEKYPRELCIGSIIDPSHSKFESSSESCDCTKQCNSEFNAFGPGQAKYLGLTS